MSSHDSSKSGDNPQIRLRRMEVVPGAGRRRRGHDLGDYVYPPGELQMAYLAWSRTPHERLNDRLDRWDRYCDVRDCVPPGTSKKKRIYAGDLFLVKASLGLTDE